MTWSEAAAVVALAALAGVCNFFFFLGRTVDPPAPGKLERLADELKTAISFAPGSELHQRIVCDERTFRRSETELLDFAGRRWILVDHMWQRAMPAGVKSVAY